jgi:aldehyde reductase
MINPIHFFPRRSLTARGIENFIGPDCELEWSLHFMSIPRIGLGTWQLDRADVHSTILYAFEEAGYTHLDCAEFYGNQPEVGVALANLFSRGKVRREDLWITSKIWNTHHAVSDVEPTLRQTLADLQIAYLDLYLIHWPCAFAKRDDGVIAADRSLKVVDLWIELQRMVSLGLTRRIGVSNFSIELLEKFRFDPRVTIQPYCNQVECSLYMQQEALIQYCEFRGIFVAAYAPLGQGQRPLIVEDPELLAVAGELGRPVGSVAIQFVLQLSPKICVLCKSRTQERLKSNIAIDFALSDEQFARLKAREKCTRYVNPGPGWGFEPFGDQW